MWAYIYQARDLLAMDESGMNGKIDYVPERDLFHHGACYLPSGIYTRQLMI